MLNSYCYFRITDFNYIYCYWLAASQPPKVGDKFYVCTLYPPQTSLMGYTGYVVVWYCIGYNYVIIHNWFLLSDWILFDVTVILELTIFNWAYYYWSDFIVICNLVYYYLIIYSGVTVIIGIWFSIGFYYYQQKIARFEEGRKKNLKRWMREKRKNK